MNVFIVCSVFSLRMYSCLGKGECHVMAKVSCDGARQLLLDSRPTVVGHLAKSGDLDKYI